jgi:cation:H+ antiporter
MTSATLQFAVCAAVIIVAGTYLTRFADAIADITKLGRLVIGSVLLAGATSLPELTVDISAVRMGLADLAVGDLLGSSLMNLLILAILDLATRSRGKMLSKQAAAHALSGLVAASLTAIVGLGLLTAKGLAPYTAFGISPAIWLIVLAYFLGVRLVYLDQRIAVRTAAEHGVEAEAPTMGLAPALGGFAVCAIVIVIAGPYLAEAAGVLADKTGLGKTFVGTTLVALSTSLPELVSMIAALRMGATDLAIGNVFGSNAFNMILLAPLDALYRNPEHHGSLFAALSPEHAITCVAVILATQVAVMGQLYQAETRVRFIEPDAWLVIAIVLGALAMIYYLH